jgi:hypothetical protein
MQSRTDVVRIEGTEPAEPPPDALRAFARS